MSLALQTPISIGTADTLTIVEVDWKPEMDDIRITYQQLSGGVVLGVQRAGPFTAAQFGAQAGTAKQKLYGLLQTSLGVTGTLT